MGLSRLPTTDKCIGHAHILPYLEQLFEHDITTMLATYPSLSRADVDGAFDEWVGRITHPAFGLSCFWVSQNAGAKLGIRFVPSVLSAVEAGGAPSEWMAFACAAMLRFLTPQAGAAEAAGGVFTGRMDDADTDTAGGGGGGGGGGAGGGRGGGGVKKKRRKEEQPATEEETSGEYVTGLAWDTVAGTYQFKDGDGSLPRLLAPLAEAGDGLSLQAAKSAVLQVFARYADLRPGGGSGGGGGGASAAVDALAGRVGALLRRMLLPASAGGEAAMAILAAMAPASAAMPPIAVADVRALVRSEVQQAPAIDVHTHLFPASHGELMLWGVDEVGAEGEIMLWVPLFSSFYYHNLA